MFASKLKLLAEHKRLIAIDADLRRNIIALEFANLRARADAVRDNFRSRGRWIFAGIAGLVAARYWRTLARMSPVLWTVMRRFRKPTAKESDV